jgi:hypothetical protein
MRGLAGASRRDVTAVSTDDSAGDGIKVTRSGIEAGKEPAHFECSGNLLHFLFSQKAGADPAQYAICFHGMLLSLTFQVIISRMRKEEAFLLEEELAPDSKWEMTQNGKSETHVWCCRSSNSRKKKPDRFEQRSPHRRAKIPSCYSKSVHSTIISTH